MSTSRHTIATIFSGGEGVGIGAQNAGFAHLWGIELVDEIAQVARNNGFNVTTGDVFDIDPDTLESPDVLHASPECQRASVANSKRGETDLDIALGKRIEYYIEVLNPKVFTLENVRPYRHFEAFKSIVNKLFEFGYMVDFQNLCAADFGVPQTRRRLILRASRIGLLPILPQKEKWIGWYEAIEDLIPNLPETQFAEWQLKRLAKMDLASLLVGCKGKGAKYSSDVKQESEPAQTVNTQIAQSKAFILAQGCYGETLITRDKRKAIFSITANTNQTGLKAFILNTRWNGFDDMVTTRNDNEPIFTVTVDTCKQPLRSWLSQGKVVSMTLRALARFQTFPDQYILPDTKTLSCKIIGNAVPCLMYEKIIKQFVPFLSTSRHSIQKG